LGLAVLVLWQPRWLVTALAKRSPEVVYYVETTEPVVALTIDDGPDRETTPGILRALAAHGARATFFLLSERVPGNEGVVSQIVEQGHELGNHLTRDERHIDLPTSEFEAVLLEAHAVLSRFGSLRWVRPGAGWYDDSVLAVVRAHGYRVALGSIYPYDAQIPFTAFAVPHVLRNLRPGSILVLHDGGARGRRTISVLQRVLPELQRRGFRVVTLSELVESRRGP
jgi:peptidoglycan/xylan/chitin deacetylase (PgdA/CDA1 family)